MKQAWPHVRAILVLLHVVALLLMALPAPGSGMTKSAWEDPTVQDEFAAWTARFNAMGFDITQDQLEERLWNLGTGVTKARTKVLDPFMPYYLYAGTWQSWRMFVAPHRYPAILHIDIQDDAGWEPIYRSRSSEYDWRRYQFDHDRMRSVTFRLSWSAYSGTYKRFVEWVCREVAKDHPDAQRVRVRFWKYKTLSAQEVRAGKSPQGAFQQTRVKPLARCR